MRNKFGMALFALLFSLGTMVATSIAYPVGPSLSLEKMAEVYDVIIKAKVISTQTVVDPAFRPLPRR